MNDEHEAVRKLTLADGVLVPVRGARPVDAPALQRLHKRLSKESIRLRFFSILKELPAQKAEYFAHVDGVNSFALVALDPTEHHKEIIAVVRFDCEEGTDKAEYTALVEDRWQGSGLGLGMTLQLIEEARDKGIRSFYGLVMPENRRMLKLLRSLDLPERERRDEGVKYVEVKLIA
jgi:N-acetylglutamate synthase-like GNAT family acetyltransferase